MNYQVWHRTEQLFVQSSGSEEGWIDEVGSGGRREDKNLASNFFGPVQFGQELIDNPVRDAGAVVASPVKKKMYHKPKYHYFSFEAVPLGKRRNI